jgi:phosphoglycerate dehydrogenase-like enzyme
MSMLFSVKDGFYPTEEKERKHWQRYTGGELHGRTLAVVGLGSIGREVARLGRCLGMRVIGTKRNTLRVSAAEVGVDALYPRTDLHALLGEADFVVLYSAHGRDGGVTGRS